MAFEFARARVCVCVCVCACVCACAFEWVHRCACMYQMSRLLSLTSHHNNETSTTASVNTDLWCRDHGWLLVFVVVLPCILIPTTRHQYERHCVCVRVCAAGPSSWKKVRNAVGYGGAAFSLTFPRETVRFFLWPYQNLAPPSARFSSFDTAAATTK